MASRLHGWPVMRVVVLCLVIVAGATHAASLRTLRPEIPFAFEENRGQSPAAFRYVQVHENRGFACDALYAPTVGLPSPEPEKLTLTGANPACAAEIRDPLPSFSHFYRGVAKSASVENVRHYRTIVFHDVWQGVDIRYTAESSGYTMTVDAASADARARVRFSGEVYQTAETGTLGTRVGGFTVSGPVRAVVSSGQVGFDRTGSGAGAISFTLRAVAASPVPTTGLAVDADSSMYFAASTSNYSVFDSRSEWCLRGSLTDGCPDVYVAKFDSSGVFQYLVYLSGDRYDAASGIEVDAGGNVYVGGTTLSHDFVTTSGAYQERYRGPEATTVEFRSYVGGDSFLAKLHGPTGGLIYSTLFGGSGEDSAYQVRVDAFGRTYMRVGTRSQDVPRTGTPVESAPACSTSLPGSGTTCWMIVSLDENGRELRYSQQVSPTQIEVSAYGTLFYSAAGQYAALWSDGTLRWRRAIPSDVVPGPPGSDESLWAFRPIREGAEQRWVRTELLLLTPDGLGPEVVKTDLPLVRIAAVDSRGTVWVAGEVPYTADAPLRGCQGCGGVAAIDPSGNLLLGTAVPVDGQSFRARNGKLYSATPFGESTLAVVDPVGVPEPILASVSDANPRGYALLPGNVLVLTGGLIGPDVEAYRPVDASGRLATEVGGYRVLFGGSPAPILFASRDRLVVQVPLVQQTPWSALTIERNGRVLVARPLQASFARGPIILAGPTVPDASFVIRNADGSANSAENPGTLGTVVSFLVAGVGETDPPLVQGELTHTVLARPRVTPTVSFSLGQPPAEVISFQQAQDQPAGIMDMRVRLPQTAPGLDPSVNWWALFFVDPRLPIPATSQDPLRIYIRR